MLTFRFINSDDTVDLGYVGWTDVDEACTAFKQYITYNGGALPATATLQGFDQKDGLCLQNITFNVGDVITIAKGAVFTHGNVKMTLGVELSYTWNGTKFIVAIDGETVYNYQYEIVDGVYYEYDVKNSEILFSFANSEKTVDFGYTGWTDPDADTEAFKSYIKLNGEALPASARLQGYNQAEGLALSGLTLAIGDEITIVKGAVFTHGDIKVTFGVDLTYMWNGLNYTVSVDGVVTKAPEETKQAPAKQTWEYINRYDETTMDAYLRPIWYTREVYDESALIIGETGWTTLLYTPDSNYEVVVRDYHLNKTYVQDVDFKIEGNKIVRLAGGSLPYMTINQYVSNQQVGAYALPFDATRADSQLGDVSGYTHLAYYSDAQLLPYHINVSYRTNEAWDGYVPTSQSSAIAKFTNKLKTQKQGQILFYGDSITFGCDATGHQSGGNASPYLPRWSELVTEWMARQYDANITYLNGAVGGWTTNDGVNYWNQVHTSSQMGQNNQIPANYMATTDLLVLAFGMNDATNNTVSSTNYKSNIRTMINNYLSANPNGEVLLMSCMLPNTQSTWYTQNGWHEGVESALYQVASEYTAGNVAVAPITSMFKSFETQGKMTRDVLANNINHPNDFGVRVYAQTVLKTIAGDVYGLERTFAGLLPDEADGYVEKPLRQPDPVLNPVADRKANVTYRNITMVGTHAYSSAGNVYASFYDKSVSTTEGQYLGKDAGASSKTDVDLQNFAKQLIYNDRYIFTDYVELIVQGLPSSGNFNVSFQHLNGATFKRGDSITIPRGAIYEYDSNGDGTIDYAWVFGDTFKIVYNPTPSCSQTAGCEQVSNNPLWHVYKLTESYTYHVTLMSYYQPIADSTRIGFYFLNNTDQSLNTINLGYTDWTPPDEDCANFLKYIKINGTPVTTAFPGAVLQGFDKKDGLHLAGLSLNTGDVITIDSGAVFKHNGISMITDYTFSFTFNGGTSFTVTKA